MDNVAQSLKAEILKYCPDLSEEEWNSFQPRISIVSYKKGTTIFPSTEVCKHILFIKEGIVASQYQSKEDFVISRFFKSKGLATNIVSLLSDQLDNDRLFAITPVQGVLISKSLFLENYLSAKKIGQYFRKRLLEVIVEDKQFITIKTISKVPAQLAFLQEHYPEVLLEAPWKYIANFMGVTPAWLSRVLKSDPRKMRNQGDV